jgi:hypothetical protein
MTVCIFAHVQRRWARSDFNARGGSRPEPISEEPSTEDLREKGVRLAQQMEVGPCIPMGTQLGKAEVGPTSGPTGCLSHLAVRGRRAPVALEPERLRAPSPGEKTQSCV